MNAPVRRLALGLLLLAACALVGAQAQYRQQIDLDEISLSGRTPESIILLWPAYSYRLARQMIAKYGQPAEATDHSLVWRDNGPWGRTTVYRIAPGEPLLWKKRGRLEQSVAYRVPKHRLDALARFDPELAADATEGRITARSDDEGDNFLAVNLADEVLRGHRTPREARSFRLNAVRLREAGKASPYFDRLLFGSGR